MKKILPYAGSALLAVLLSGCITPEYFAESLAEDSARNAKIDVSRYDRVEVRRVAPYHFWYAAYEKRGQPLPTGNEFAVLVDYTHHTTEVVPGGGVRTASAKQELDVAKQRWIREDSRLYGKSPRPRK